MVRARVAEATKERRPALWPSLLMIASVLTACAAQPSTTQIALVVSRAQQAADDVASFPVEIHGRWVLSGPKGTWLQRDISPSSEPWLWTSSRCTVLNASLVPGMRSFMHTQLTGLFTSALAASLESRFLRTLDMSTNPQCVRNNQTLTVGPPGPILDQTRISKVQVTGASASIAARVTVTDWQGGVTHQATAGNGRVVGWAVVRGLLNARYVLHRDASGRWRVSSYSTTFVPGYEP